MVAPFGKLDPGALVVVMVTVPGQLSVAVGGVQVTFCAQLVATPPPLAFAPVVVTVILPGQPANTGFSRSLTVTVKLQVDELPAASVFFQVTVVTPLLKDTPASVVEVVVPVVVAPLNV